MEHLRKLKTPARHLTPRERKDLVERIKKGFRMPDARRDLRQAGERVQKGLGLTGNYQYDDNTERVKFAEWYNGIKDLRFTANVSY